MAACADPKGSEGARPASPGRWVLERERTLWEELRALQGADIAERRRRLRALQLELHPDKQPPELRAHSRHLFQIVQCEWEAAQEAVTQQRLQQAEPSGGSCPGWSGLQAKRPGEEAQQPRAAGGERPAPAARPPPPRSAPAAAQGPGVGQVPEERGHGAERAASAAEADAGTSDDEVAESWDDDEAARRCHLEEEERQRREGLGRYFRKCAFDPRKADTFPVELHFIDPNNPRCVNGDTLYKVAARRCWTVGDVKDELEATTGICRLSQRISRRMSANKDIELEDDDVLGKALPGSQMVQRVVLFICPALYCDYVYLLGAVRRNFRCLRWAPLPFRSNARVLRAGLQQSWEALRYASRAARMNRSLVSAAVKQHGLALELAGDVLRDDRKLVLKAVQQDWRALEFASQRLRADREIVLSAVAQDASALQQGAPELLQDKAFVRTAVQRNGLALRFLAPELASDRGIVLAAVRRDPMALQFASSACRASREIVLAAVRLNGKAMAYAAPELTRDCGFMEEISGNAEALRCLPEELREGAEGGQWDRAYDMFPSLDAWQARLLGNLNLPQGSKVASLFD